AFNYAGSESILTSLWKIDEQSSAKIISLFYEYLAEGYSKDKALRRAKLDYMLTAEGRTAAPQYWAGLVLMGDSSAIQLNGTAGRYYWLIGVIVLILILGFIVRKGPFSRNP
ncbi:MAG: CHAT domain-containing protein, partial [Flavobacteriaceae bacterium]